MEPEEKIIDDSPMSRLEERLKNHASHLLLKLNFKNRMRTIENEEKKLDHSDEIAKPFNSQNVSLKTDGVSHRQEQPQKPVTTFQDRWKENRRLIQKNIDDLTDKIKDMGFKHQIEMASDKM